MSELGYNVYGVVVGTIGVIVLIPALAFAILGLPPTSKLKLSESFVQETEKMFREAVEEGLIHREGDLYAFHAWFWRIKMHLDETRLDVYCIRSWKDELVSWCQGLSGRIHVAYTETCKLRKKLAKTSTRERRELAAAGHTAKLASLSGLRSRASRHLPGMSSRCPAASYGYIGACSPPNSEHNYLTTGVPFSRVGARGCPERDDHVTPLPVCSSFHHTCHGTMHMHGDIPDGDTARHVVTDSDLKALLSIAIANPTAFPSDGDANDKRRRRAARQEVLLRFGRQLYGPDFTPPPSNGSALPEPLGTHGRFKAFSRLLWCSYSSRLHDAGEHAPTGHASKEPPTPQRAATEGCGTHDVD